MTTDKQSSGTQPPACGKISEERLRQLRGCLPEVLIRVVPSAAKDIERVFDELLSHRHPAPVADERTEVEVVTDINYLLHDKGIGGVPRPECPPDCEGSHYALSAQPSDALEREKVELPRTQCPKCKALIEDADGFGVLYHRECGYCTHASSTNDVCDFCGAGFAPPPERAPGGDALNDMNGKHAVDGISALLKNAKPLHRDAFEHLEPVPHIATLINNNQPGWTNIIETAPNVTIDVGTKLYDQKALFAVGVEMLEQGRKGGFEDGFFAGKAYQKDFASTPPPSSSPSATADATSSVASATLRAALEKDAARYRWLREQRRWLYNLPPTPGISLKWENYIAGPSDWLDSAIDDAALAGNEGEK